MTPLLFVVSDARWAAQVALYSPRLRRPVTVWPLGRARRGVWDAPALWRFRETLAAHAGGDVVALGEPAARLTARVGAGLRLPRVFVAGGAGRRGPLTRFLARRFRPVAWPWAVPPAGPPLDRPAVLAAHGIRADAFAFTASSWFETKDDGEAVIWGFENLRYAFPNMYLLIHGDGPARREVETFAHQLAPEGSRVRFTGTDLPLPGFFGVGDVAVAMTGESLTAALAAGKPIIAADGLRELLAGAEDAVAWMDPARPADVGKQMMKALTDAALRERLAMAGVGLRERFAAAEDRLQWPVENGKWSLQGSNL